MAAMTACLSGGKSRLFQGMTGASGINDMTSSEMDLEKWKKVRPHNNPKS